MRVGDIKALLNEFDDNKEVYCIGDTGRYTKMDVYFQEEEIYYGRDLDMSKQAVVMYGDY